jgi:uncharacterized protein
MKIDIFAHIFPQAAFDKWFQAAPNLKDMGKRVRNVPVLFDLDLRFRVMDRFGEYRQVISMASPPLETFAGPEVTPGLARIANDQMAELVMRHPDRFAGFAACLPMNHPGEAERELRRAMRDLGARGVQIFSNVNGRALDRDEFRFLFQIMSEMTCRSGSIRPAAPTSPTTSPRTGRSMKSGGPSAGLTRQA